jgi:hypothetical protein
MGFTSMIRGLLLKHRFSCTIFWLAFAMLAVGRWFVAGKGYADDTDVYPFLFIRVMYLDLVAFNLHTWLDTIFVTIGSLPDTFIRFIQTSLVLLLIDEKKQMLGSYEIFRLVGHFNFITSLLIVLVYYCFLRRLGVVRELAVIGMLLFGTLIANNIYMRHILPYDHSLLLHLTAMFVLAGKKLSNRRVLFAGCLTALALTNYYGFYMLGLITGMYVLYNERGSFNNMFAKGFIFALPAMVLIVSFELLCRIDGRSYLSFIKEFSQTIYHGSFDETPIYFWIYSTLVEKTWGVVLLVLSAMGGALMLRSKVKNPLVIWAVLGLSGYVVHSIYGYFFEGMVFYARVFRLYYIFIILAVVYLLQWFDWSSKRVVVTFILAVIMVRYFYVIMELNAIGYPHSIVNEWRMKTTSDALKVEVSHSSAAGIDYINEKGDFYSRREDKTTLKGKYIAENFCFFIHYPDSLFLNSYKPALPASEKNVVLDKLHFMSYPLYTLEYCTREGREYFMEKKFRIKLIRKDD